MDDAVYRSVERDDVPEPLAMSVATVDAAGRPDVRTVLMRFFDPAGPGFVANLESAKGVQIAGNPGVAAALVWPAMYRAIRFRGTAHQLGRDEVERYFGERPWGSRISAWASRQSQVIEGRSGLEEAYQRYAARWPDLGGPPMSRSPTSGAATGSPATRWSSGPAGPTGCTTGWFRVRVEWRQPWRRCPGAWRLNGGKGRDGWAWNSPCGLGSPECGQSRTRMRWDRSHILTAAVLA